MFRLVRRLVAVVAATAVVYLVVTFVQVVLASRGDDARKADAIVVLGAAQYDGEPSPVLRARLDHTLDLYRREIAPTIMVTGGRRPGDRVTEATASADYLVGKGVRQSAILREVKGRNSWQSLAAAANELHKRGMDSVVLVSDPFHSARIAAMADELGLDAAVSPTRTSPIVGADAASHLAREAIAVSLGRIVGFRRMVGIDQVVLRPRTGAENR